VGGAPPGRLAVVNAPAADLLTLADLPEAQGALLLDGGATDDALRRRACRANVLHTAPGRAMLAGALAQPLVTRRWTEWYLLAGRTDADRAFAEAIRRSAAKFGAEIVEEHDWSVDADIRRNAAQEIPPLTQDAEHDVMIVADESEDGTATCSATPGSRAQSRGPRG
jgi:ABC transporter substrate binding protein (PQQ-dependent alcohol dehydrogenase system)